MFDYIEREIDCEGGMKVRKFLMFNYIKRERGGGIKERKFLMFDYIKRECERECERGRERERESFNVRLYWKREWDFLMLNYTERERERERERGPNLRLFWNCERERKSL